MKALLIRNFKLRRYTLIIYVLLLTLYPFYIMLDSTKFFYLLLIDYDVNNKEDADKVEAFYEQIKDHSSIEIELPFADQFWGGKMGVFTDKYGVRWMLHGQDYTAIQQ